MTFEVVSAHFTGAANTIITAAERATEATAQQALQDCNYYCKQDTSALINSSLLWSETSRGLLRWVTPYAEHQYDYPGTRRVKNPNATPQWCKTAQDMHLTEWNRVFENAIRRFST